MNFQNVAMVGFGALVVGVLGYGLYGTIKNYSYESRAVLNIEGKERVVEHKRDEDGFVRTTTRYYIFANDDVFTTGGWDEMATYLLIKDGKTCYVTLRGKPNSKWGYQKIIDVETCK